MALKVIFLWIPALAAWTAVVSGVTLDFRTAEEVRQEEQEAQRLERFFDVEHLPEALGSLGFKDSESGGIRKGVGCQGAGAVLKGIGSDERNVCLSRSTQGAGWYCRQAHPVPNSACRKLQVWCCKGLQRQNLKDLKF